VSRDVDIMEFADGERPWSDAGPSGDVKAKVDAIRELGELVRGRLELAADEVSQPRIAAMWREIDKAIQVDADADEVVDRTSDRGGLWHGIGRFFDRYRAHVLVGAVSAGAVAALALLLQPSRDGGRSIARDPIRASAVSHRPAEIDELSTPGGVGTVFSLNDEDGSTTVIWVTPEDTVEGI